MRTRRLLAYSALVGTTAATSVPQPSQLGPAAARDALLTALAGADRAAPALFDPMAGLSRTVRANASLSSPGLTVPGTP